MVKSKFTNFLIRMALLFIFSGHIVAFAAWWLVSPKGFTWSQPRFWTNSIIPLIVCIFSIAGLVGIHLQNKRLLAILLPSYPAAALAFMIAGRILYPISVRPVFLVILLVWFLILCLLIGPVFRQTRITWKQSVPMFLLVILAIFIGAFLPWSQRSLLPATRPLNPSSPPGTDLPLNPMQTSFQLSNRVTVLPQYAGVLINETDRYLEVSPLLTFYSRSPDRCWILFALRADRIGTRRTFKGMRRIPDGLVLEYTDDGRSMFEVRTSEPETTVQIEAFSELPSAVYSHLNTFTELTIQGKHKLFVSFSPCAEKRIEVTPFDYPFGRPSRLAYLDETGIFRVVQAKSAEKGPFEILAEGPLAKDSPLELTLYDGEDAIYRIVFSDWAAQASMQLSPTAGWGLPENAIEFCLDQEDLPQATFYITLAATSAGRGFDSVGHTPGIYRNRIQIEILNK